MALEFPPDTDRRHGKVRFQFVPHENNAAGVDGQTVVLPLPPTIALGDQLEYEKYDAGISGQVVRAAMDQAQSGALSDFMKNMGNRYTGADGNVDFGKLKTDLTSKIGSNTMKDASGVRAHPDTRSIFKAPNLRTMQFDFKLVALQGSDSLLIKEIIKEFRKNAYPEKDGGEDEPNLFYRLPNLCKVKMFLGGIHIPPKFKDMYITGVSVTYGGMVLSEMDANHWFSETNLSVSLTESETLTSQRVMEGY
jgi:hypothetical protein